MKSAIKFFFLLVFWLCGQQASAQLLVHPDSYLIPNNYDFWEYGDAANELSMGVVAKGNRIFYVWQELGLDTSNYVLCYKVIDRWGQIVHDVDTIHEPSDEYRYLQPQVAALKDGRFIVSWMDLVNPWPASRWNTFYRFLDNDGNKIGDHYKLVPDSIGKYQEPLIIGTRSGGHCFFVWDQRNAPPNSSIFYYWVQCFDSLNNPLGNYEMIGKMKPYGSWREIININDSTLLLVCPAQRNVPPYDAIIQSIRINDKGQALDSTWFAWDVLSLDSLYANIDIVFHNNTIYATSTKVVTPGVANTVVAKFSHDLTSIIDTIQPNPSRILQQTPWVIVNDDSLQSQTIRGRPQIAVMNLNDRIVINWVDNRTNPACSVCWELYAQYLDTNLTLIGNNFHSASSSLNQTVWWQDQNKLSADLDYYVQIFSAEANLPISNVKIWTNIYSVSTVGIAEPIKANQIHVFPNPATTHITLALPAHNGQPVPYTLQDMLGHQVLRGTLTQPTEQINIAALKPGMYLLKTHHAEFTAVSKVVVSKR